MSPPPAFPRGKASVSFDTFDTKYAPLKLFTLNYKPPQYTATSKSRIFVCGLNGDASSESTMEWAMADLADDGDEIIGVYVIKKESTFVSPTALKHNRYRTIARDLLENAIHNNRRGKAIKIVVEVVTGKIPEIVPLLVELYDPEALVVALDGEVTGGIPGLSSGSLSNYCLQYSPVPVIVLRPDKRPPSRRGSILSMDEKSPSVIRRSSQSKRGILKNKHETPLIRQSFSSDDAHPDEPSQQPGFALPIGFLSTEKGPRADLAMMSPSIAALEEEWDEDDLKITSVQRPRHTPKPREKPPSLSKQRDKSSSLSESEDNFLRPKKIVDKQRPSFSETTPWLASILGPVSKKTPVQGRRHT